MNPLELEFLDLEECEPCEVCVDVPMNPLGEMCQNVRGANGTVKNEQAKDRRTNNKKKNKKKGANKRAASASAEEAEDVVKKAKHVQPDEWVAAELCRCSVEQWVEYSWEEKERRLLAELWEYAEDCDMHLFEDKPEDEMSEASLLADEENIQSAEYIVRPLAQEEQEGEDGLPVPCHESWTNRFRVYAERTLLSVEETKSKEYAVCSTDVLAHLP